MAFEIFRRTGRRVDTAAIVLIPAGGRLGLNSPACKLLREAGVGAVLLLWDRATKTIALKATKKTNEDAYTIQYHKNGHSATMSGAGFLRWIGWTGEKRITAPAKWIAGDKRLEAVLPIEPKLSSDETSAPVPRKHRKQVPITGIGQNDKK